MQHRPTVLIEIALSGDQAFEFKTLLVDLCELNQQRFVFNMKEYQRKFIKFMIEANVLQFEDHKLKSGRLSPVLS